MLLLGGKRINIFKNAVWRNTLTLFIAIAYSSLFWSCENKEECIQIVEKQIIGGNYYFYWDNDDYYRYSTAGDPNVTGTMDNYRSGQVSKAIYDTFSVGETYCYTP